MNHECYGDVFERWGKRWGRCFGDGSFFDYEEGIEWCPKCKRPWCGVSTDEKNPDKKHSYIPDEDSAVLLQIDLPHFKKLVDERGRKIVLLEEKLDRWQFMYYKEKGMDYLASLCKAAKE